MLFLCLQLTIVYKMASAATPLCAEIETVTCPTCQDSLQNPSRLNCLHRFCNNCLDNIDHTVQQGRTGILCPVCRKFTGQSDIKKDPILEALVEAFSQHNENVFNPGQMDKTYHQCGRRNIADAESHPVVNVTKYCPKHITKPIEFSCVQCKLAMCMTCKIEEHGNHKTEDVASALTSVLPEVRTSTQLLDAERGKQLEVKQELVSLVREVTNLGKEILHNAERTRDNLMSRAMQDYSRIEETVTNFVQSVTKEAGLREGDANNCISSIDSMSSWTDVLANNAEGSTILFQVRNERLLDRVRALLSECQESRDVRELQQKATTQLTFRETSLECENIVGSIQCGEASLISPSQDNECDPPPSYESLQHSLVIKQTSPKRYKPLPKDIVTRHTAPSQQSPVHVKSFRHIDKLLSEVKKLEHSFELRKSCYVFCYHQESLWCPFGNEIAIYTLDGKLLRSVECRQMTYLNSLHPLTPTCLLLAGERGFYMYNSTQQVVSKTLRQGVFRSVHASGTHIVALEKRNKPGDLVHVFSTTDPPTLSHSFCVNHTNAVSLMVHNQHVYVSASYGNTSVSVYTIQGELVSYYGKKGRTEPGHMDTPKLCGVDSDETLLIADCYNNRLQLMDTKGGFCVMDGVDVGYPFDALIVGGDLFVLGYKNSNCSIQAYKLV